MKLGQTLKTIWEALAYGPHCPHEEVKEQLEERGYKFSQMVDTHAPLYGSYAAPLYLVFNQSGARVHYHWKDDPASAQFRKDYDAVISERRTPKP